MTIWVVYGVDGASDIPRAWFKHRSAALIYKEEHFAYCTIREVTEGEFCG